jgi:hypothetical protein
MDKNRIEGRYGTTSWHNTAKSSGLPVEVNAVVVQGSIVLLPGEIWRERSGQKSAEAIVVEETSRGLEAARLNCETGGLTSMKGRTDRCPNHGMDAPADNASRRGMDESRSDGKHVGTLRGLVPR